MISACATFLELRGFGLGLPKSAFNAENFKLGCFGLSSVILAQFTLEMCVTARNRAKFILEPSIFGVRGHSRSSMLTFLRSSSLVLVTISSMFVPICNRLYARAANSCKITFFTGGACIFASRSRRCPSPSGIKFCHKILKTLKVSYGKNQKSLSHVGSNRYRVVTDRQIDEQTELPQLIRAIAMLALVRKSRQGRVLVRKFTSTRINYQV